MKINLLFVEDDLVTQAAFKRFTGTEDFPYDYTLAGSVAEARQALTTTPFDVIVSSHELGDGTAFNLLGLAGDAPIIVVTATSDEIVAIKALKSGIYDYLIKDLDHSYFRFLPIAIENAIQHKQQEQQHRMLSHAIKEINDSVCITDQAGQIIFVNQGFCRIYGYSSEEVLGQPYRLLLGSLNMDADPVEQNDVYHRHKDGRTIPVALSRSTLRDDLGQEVAMVEIARDISDRKKAEANLRYQAFHDPLTGLPNRALFMNRLEAAIERATQDKTYQFAVLFLDLDRFKLVNDSLGYIIGDQLLIVVAQTLEKSIRSGDTVARVGGDEFTILLEGIRETGEVTQVAGRIQQTLASPVNLDGYEVFVSASIGITLSSLGYYQSGDLLRDTDTAMYRAKTMGRSRYEVFDLTMYNGAMIRLQLDIDLRRAVEREQFQLYYQPIISLMTGRIVGVETLIRWQHPQRGLISPADFIPIAEETGLIVAMGEWILRTACVQMKGWHEAGHRSLRVAINLSARQFQSRRLLEVIKAALYESGLDPRMLELEITESVAMMQEIEENTAVLRELSDLGVHLSIDDFGTGYSSLIYLKRFPITTLKIDKSFIKNIASDSGDTAITTAIIALTRSLALTVIAEGVETSEQLISLRELQCDEVQGYLFSKPIPAAQLTSLLSQGCDRWTDIMAG